METIELEDGKIGTLTIADLESEKLGTNQLFVDGHKFTCSEKFREAFEEYLASIKSEQVRLTYLHSIKPKYPQEKIGASKNRNKNPPKPDQIFYNCTVQVSKTEALASFNNYASRYGLLMAFNLFGGREKLSKKQETDQLTGPNAFAL